MTLLMVLFRCLRRPFLAVILPRLSVIVCRYSQAILIDMAIRFVTDYKPDTVAAMDGRGLILTSIIVYTGMAVRP